MNNHRFEARSPDSNARRGIYGPETRGLASYSDNHEGDGARNCIAFQGAAFLKEMHHNHHRI